MANSIISTGVGDATAGMLGQQPRFSARTHLDSDRYRALDRKGSYFNCNQHDFKTFDFEGRVISSRGGMSATQPLLTSEVFASYIPLRSRRPSAPHRLARVIVNAFTNLIFGEGRFPTFRVDGDPDTEDYVQALVREMNLPGAMIQARNLGGAMGSVGLSWCFLDGKPRCEVHNSKYLYVHEWIDRGRCKPRHVTEVYQVPRLEWDQEKQRFLTNLYWYRRDWMPDVDIVFKQTRVELGKDPVWTPDLSKSAEHGDGVIHFVWIQNLPTADVDGESDYEGLYEALDSLDVLGSVITRGATLNLDPTLKIKMDPDLLNRAPLRKGSDNALVVGEGGDADYLELGGQSISAGIELFKNNRKSILEVAGCVVPDPDEITANGTSSVAMKMLYAPMLGGADIRREQYIQPVVEDMLEPMLEIVRKTEGTSITMYDSDGNEVQVKQEFDLPQRVEKTPKLDENKMPTGEEEIKKTDRHPGDGGQIEAQWGPYFLPTPDDQSKTVTTLGIATGNQAFLSTETATEIAMIVFGRTANEEKARVAKEKQAQMDQQSSMFADANGDMGGKVKHTQPTPGGGSITRSTGGPPPGLPPGMGDDEDGDKGKDDDDEDKPPKPPAVKGKPPGLK